MFRFLGRTVRWAAVGTLVVVGLVAMVGVTRVKNAYWSVREHLASNVDDLVDSRVALRHELSKLEREYPRRIADLQSALLQVDRDLAACESDRRVSSEAVTIAENDVSLLRERLAAADRGDDGGGFVSVEFRSEVLDREAAVTRASRIAERVAYHRERFSDLGDEATLLRQERTRLAAELADLEREYRAFQAEAGSLLREIESVRRKEKLAALVERRRKQHDDLFRDGASSLALVKEKIERRRIELDTRLEAARAADTSDEYEARARLRLAERGGR
jgi:hypothetical protein